MISITGITKRFHRSPDRRLAVDDLTFDISAGRVTGFVGPNGSGKSTTMRVMVGLVRPDHGVVDYDGIALQEMAQPSRIVGAVLDPRCMHPGRTPRQHLRAAAAHAGIAGRRVDEVLADVGLTSVADRRVREFSLGMRQRLAIAGALLGEPEVLLLDEPTNGLDPDGIRWLRSRLEDFAADGGTVFVSSHLIGELSMFADDLIVIGSGRLLAAGPVDELSRRVESSVSIATPDAEPLLALLIRSGFDARSTDDRVEVRTTTADQVSQLAFEHQIRLVEVTEVKASLEDIVLELTQADTEFTSA